MIRRPPRSTRTDTLFPYTTLFRSICLRNDSRSARRHGSNLAEGFAQFLLRFFQHRLLPVIEVAPRAVDVEGQHRHRRLQRAALAPPAPFRRRLERCRDRSAERRGGTECVSTCRSKSSPAPSQKKT